MVLFSGVPLDVYGQPVVGKLQGGKRYTGEWLFLGCSVDAAELFVFAVWDFVFALWVFLPQSP